MGLFNSLKKKKEDHLDLPPNAPMADELDLPPPPIESSKENLDEPPRPDDFIRNNDLNKPVFAQDHNIETDGLDPINQIEEEIPSEENLSKINEVPMEQVEMPEEIEKEHDGSKIKKDDFDRRIKRLQNKLHKNKIIDAEIDRLKTENDYLKSRIEKITTIVESLPISEIDTRIEQINKDNRENKKKLSDVFDKLSLHSNLINETMGIRDEFSGIKDSGKDQKKQIEMLSDSLESYKNTLYMLNKKVELVDNGQRIEKVENKIKEIIVYLNKITRIITKE